MRGASWKLASLMKRLERKLMHKTVEINPVTMHASMHRTLRQPWECTTALRTPSFPQLPLCHVHRSLPHRHRRHRRRFATNRNWKLEGSVSPNPRSPLLVAASSSSPATNRSPWSPGASPLCPPLLLFVFLIAFVLLLLSFVKRRNERQSSRNGASHPAAAVVDNATDCLLLPLVDPPPPSSSHSAESPRKKSR